jgi:OOP family OmpA-OmpF porin
MKNKLLAVALLSALTAPAFAENMYGSLSLGSASDQDLSGAGQSSTGMSYSLLFGYKVNKNFAAEIGYTSLLSSASVTNTAATTETTNGFEVAGIGSYPINDQFSIFGRLGYASLNASYSPGTTASLSGFVYGPGVQYDISKEIGVRVGYNIYNTQGSSGDSIVNNAYASALYSF